MNYVRLSLCLLMLAGCEKGRDDIDGFGRIDFAGLDSTETDAEVIIDNPTTCAEAEENRSYVGCDYWPTVTPNPTFSTFHFAAVVANPSDSEAVEVTVTGPKGYSDTKTILPNSLDKFLLPWVDALKGKDQECFSDGQNIGYASAKAFDTTVKVEGGAYHLVSSIPVVVYQFSPLEYDGEAAKATCPACGMIECLSYTNDASLLLPSTAMTGSYRIASLPSIGERSMVTITATSPNTTEVTVQLSNRAQIVAGGGIAGVAPGGKATFSLEQGDVVELIAPATVKVDNKDVAADFTGSLIGASRPVQVIGGISSSTTIVPTSIGVPCCADHMEEIVFPAETLGTEYVVTVPSAPRNINPPTKATAQMIRFVGSVDGTQLQYDPPVGSAPKTLQAGEVVTLPLFGANFLVRSLDNKPFIVQTVMREASVIDTPEKELGDPSLSVAVATAQYRKKYVFLAPTDYTVNKQSGNFADIVAPEGTALILDGVAVTNTPSPVGTSGFNVIRVSLVNKSGDNAGTHVIEADQPIGVQVVGYGQQTSYQYPAGINLRRIAEPPPIM